MISHYDEMTLDEFEKLFTSLGYYEVVRKPEFVNVNDKIKYLNMKE